MNRTYAYNSIIFGVLAALWIGASTDNLILAGITLVAVSIVGFIAIRFLENMISKGVDKAADAAVDAFARKKKENEGK